MTKRLDKWILLGLASLSATSGVLAQSAPNQTPADQSAARVNPSSTSNTTTANDTKRSAEQLSTIQVSAKSLSLGGGLMSVQEASKAVSTITREAIEKAAPGAVYSQMIESIPGVVAISDDVTGLNDGNYQIRGFTNDEIGVTVNGAPISDSGNYRVYPSEYGDTENMGDITVLQGYPDVDQAVAGAAGGTIAWATIDPSHQASVDWALSGGSHSYEREFIRLQTGDTGPLRSWISYSHNQVDLWRGDGNSTMDKIDGKSIWTIDDQDSVTASLQYNREQKYAYQTESAATAASNYYANYDTVMTSPTDTNYWKLHTNPFRNYMLSLDGEFTLSNSLRLSVVPYFQYGGGGGGGGYTFTESTNPKYDGYYRYTNQDINYDGTICYNQPGAKTNCSLAYELAQSYTWRPGIIAKLIQDFGRDDSLEYGFWIDKPRQEQREDFAPTYQGEPIDIWLRTNNNLITYPGTDNPQYLYLDSTETSLRRLFATNTWTPTDQWTVTLGAAYTWVQRQGTGFEYAGATAGPTYLQQFGGYSSESWHKATPTAGVKYQLDEQNQFYLGYGRTFRAPVNGVITQSGAAAYYFQQNPDQTPGGGLTPAQVQQILADNKPETSDTLDLGWRYYADRFSASVDAYASNLKNKQVSGYEPNSGQTIYVTVPELHQRGINAEASYKILDDLTLYGSYAHTTSTLQDNTVTYGDGTYPTAGKNFVDVPKNTAYLALNYDHGPFWAGVAVKYRGAFWADWVNTQKAPGFTTMDFNAGWRFDDFASWFTKPQLKLNVFNLTSKHALTFDSATTFLATSLPGSANLDGTGKPLYVNGAYYNLLEPRTFMLTLSGSFGKPN